MTVVVAEIYDIRGQKMPKFHAPAESTKYVSKSDSVACKISNLHRFNPFLSSPET